MVVFFLNGKGFMSEYVSEAKNAIENEGRLRNLPIRTFFHERKMGFGSLYQKVAPLYHDKKPLLQLQ